MVDIPLNWASKLSKIPDCSAANWPTQQTDFQGPKGDNFEELYHIKYTESEDNSKHRKMSCAVAPNGLADKLLTLLKSVREPLADYQEKKGISKNQDYTFFALITAVSQYIYSVLVALVNMIYNLFPIVDAFLLILRFLIDKVIDIIKSENDRALKGTIFAVEFIAIVLMIVVISGLILVPLSILFGHMMGKVWHALC